MYFLLHPDMDVIFVFLICFQGEFYVTVSAGDPLIFHQLSILSLSYQLSITYLPVIYDYCFTSLSAQSWQYRDRRMPEVGTMPYSYFEWLQRFFIVHSTIGSTSHFIPLNSWEHCICTTTMTNIRPDRDSNLVPAGYKPLSIRMRYRGRLIYQLSWRYLKTDWIL